MKLLVAVAVVFAKPGMGVALYGAQAITMGV
jgi:hypothetical protein